MTGDGYDNYNVELSNVSSMTEDKTINDHFWPGSEEWS